MANGLPTTFLRSVMLKRDEVESFDAYPFNIPAIRNLNEIGFHSAVTFFVGDNGTGKSTLLEGIAVACGFNPEGGTMNFRFSTRESHSPLHAVLRMVRGVKRPTSGFFLRAESFFNVATEIERLGVGAWYGKTPLHEMSHGESFWTLLTEKFLGGGLFLLDEPEAALSPSRQLSTLARIDELVKDGSQFIIATHSPILMAYPKSRIFSFGQDAILETRYEDTEHYTVTRDFLIHRETMLRELLDTDPQLRLDEDEDE